MQLYTLYTDVIHYTFYTFQTIYRSASRWEPVDCRTSYVVEVKIIRSLGGKLLLLIANFVFNFLCLRNFDYSHPCESALKTDNLLLKKRTY